MTQQPQTLTAAAAAAYVSPAQIADAEDVRNKRNAYPHTSRKLERVRTVLIALSKIEGVKVGLKIHQNTGILTGGVRVGHTCYGIYFGVADKTYGFDSKQGGSYITHNQFMRALAWALGTEYKNDPGKIAKIDAVIDDAIAGRLEPKPCSMATMAGRAGLIPKAW